MPPHFPELPIVTPDPPRKETELFSGFLGLPIVTPDPPRKSQAEKYGSMLYLGAGGLVVVLALVGWFAYQVSGMRDLWAAIYVLHDSHRPAKERIDAAWALSKDERLNQRQRFEMVERQRGLPPAARYLLAESLTAEAAQADPRAYALAVARSQGWPDWLRYCSLLRPIAYAAAVGTRFPSEPLKELSWSSDPYIVLWAAFVRDVAGDTAAEGILERAVHADDEVSSRHRSALSMQAQLLLDAAHSEGEERFSLLKKATQEIRRGHPEAMKLWHNLPAQ